MNFLGGQTKPACRSNCDDCLITQSSSDKPCEVFMSDVATIPRGIHAESLINTQIRRAFQERHNELARVVQPSFVGLLQCMSTLVSIVKSSHVFIS